MVREAADRRKFLRFSTKGLLGFLVGTAANSTVLRGADAQVFASLFLEKNRARLVPKGYYDEKYQLYFDATERQPMFVKSLSAPATKLSPEDIQTLLSRGWTTRSLDFANTKMAVGCTVSRETSYSTTTCCPIVTDTSSDTGCDDTGHDADDD